MKLATLHLKNVAPGRAFFAPLNRKLEPGEAIDVLAMCDGNGDIARNIVAQYRNLEDWRVFEILAEPAPAPETDLVAQSAIDSIGPKPTSKRKKNKGSDFDSASQG